MTLFIRDGRSARKEPFMSRLYEARLVWIYEGMLPSRIFFASTSTQGTCLSVTPLSRGAPVSHATIFSLIEIKEFSVDPPSLPPSVVIPDFALSWDPEHMA